MAYRVPPLLTPREGAVVLAAPTGQVAAIASAPAESLGDAEYFDSFRQSLEGTGLFSKVVFDCELQTEPDLTIRPLQRCSFEPDIGAVIPLYPLLTAGVVPTIVRGRYHWAFAIEQDGRRVELDCPIKGAFGMGWIPWILRISPRWTREPRADPRIQQRLSYEVARALSELARS